MPSPFTIIQGKETNSPKKPLFLVTITSPDGDTVNLTTSAYYGAPNLVYNSTTYLAKIQKNDLQAIQAVSAQGYDTLPGFQLTLADADKNMWLNHCMTHGWRGSTVTLTVILWDVANAAYSTDAYRWTFIGGNPQHNYKEGQTTLDVSSATNFTRLKVPSVPLQYRCPWDFPSTAAQRLAALTDPTSTYYQCGYSPDQTGGVGNYSSGTTCFTTCDLTRSSATDPSVGCMARMGNAATTSVAPDGDLTHDIAGHATGRFGGVTWLAPSQWNGRQYVTGNVSWGFNVPNPALPGVYYHWVYGTQLIPGWVLAPYGDPNTTRSEVAVCTAAFGPVSRIVTVIVNGVEVPQNNLTDPNFSWGYSTQGGRNGALLGGPVWSNAGHTGLGDPHGSQCIIYIVVPAQLAAPGSVPTVQVLVSSGPLLNVYAIASVTSGVVTFTGPNKSCAGNSPFVVIITGNSNSALNGVWPLSNWTAGPPGTVTLTGTTASGTGGGCFFYQNPDLFDSGGDIVTNPTGAGLNNPTGPAANAAYALLDLMTWGNITIAQIDPVSWYNAAQICATPLNYIAADGSTQTHAQFKASFAILGSQRQSLAQVMTGLRNSANLMVAPNSSTGLIQCFVKQTLGDQQPATIPGSNYNTGVSSVHADGTAATGYYPYLFDETCIEEDSFKVTTTRIEATPNTVAFQFQDEYNGYTADSLTEIDPNSYAYSGNQEIQVPVPMNAIANFDQGTRQANVQLAEALYGNPRNDPGGTLYFEFTVNQRVLHLASRLGYICGLTWQALGIGVSSPQPVRLLSLTPDTDGEHWRVKCAWHRDAWYTYAYGQNPTPFQNGNPTQAIQTRPPYPWKPGTGLGSGTDSLFPGRANKFSLGVSTAQYPAQITIGGQTPVNALSGLQPPIAPLQGSFTSTGGSIVPGTYYFKFTTNGLIGPVSNTVLVTVPAGTSTNTIAISNIRWPGGAATAPGAFAGPHSWAMTSQGVVGGLGITFTTSVPDANGNPTKFVFTALSNTGGGLPDSQFSEFLVEEFNIAHGGVFGDEVAGVTGSGPYVLTLGGSGWTTNQFAGYILSLYYRPGVAVQPLINIPVTSNTSTTFTVATNVFLPGDVVVMRAKSGSITSNTIGDANFVNADNGGTGLAVNQDAGNLIIIISGTGALQSPKTIASNTSTVFTINGAWDVTPDATSVFIVIAPTATYTYPTNPISNNGSVSAAYSVATTQAVTVSSQSLLIVCGTADTNGTTAPMQYQPFREVYIPPQAVGQVAVTTTPYSVTLTDELVTLKTGSSVVNLPSQSALLRQPVWLVNTSSSSVTINAFSGETIEGSASVTLAPGARFQLMPNS